MGKKDNKSADKNAGGKSAGKGKGTRDKDSKDTKDSKDSKGTGKGAQSINVRHILVSTYRLGISYFDISF